MSRSRFHSPTSSLDLGGLRAWPRRALGVFCACAVALHLSLVQVRAWSKQQKAVQPLTTRFIKREPRLSKPLEMKKRPHPKQRRLRREMISVKAKAGPTEARVGFQAPRVLQNLTRPQVSLQRQVGPQTGSLGFRVAAEVIEGSKEPANRLDFSLELLDVQAMDTGEYHAMVIQDPRDKRAVKGYFRLATPYPPTMQLLTNNRVGISTAMAAIVEAMNKYTHIRVELWKSFPIHSREVFKTPFIFLTANRWFDLTQAELDNLGKYMLRGGFILADDDDCLPWGPVDVSFHRMFEEALASQSELRGRDWDFHKIPRDHALYHCFLDFDGLPPGNDEFRGKRIRRDHLEGVTIDGRLLALISVEDLTTIWTVWGTGTGVYRDVNPTRHYQLGVNMVIFALTQEGSITHQVMDEIQ